METIGLNPNRLRIEFMSGADGNLLAEATNDFTRNVKALGPIGKAEGIDEKEWKFKLAAVRKLVPYIKLVERERLRVPSRSEEAYAEFFESDEVDTLFHELFSDTMAISQILLLLRETPLSTVEISQRLGLNPSEVSRHMNRSSRQGLVKYDVERRCYALA